MEHSVGNELTITYPGSPIELRFGFYILDENRQPVYIGEDMERFVTFRKDFSKSIVKKTDIGPARISTVFLGTDHNWHDEGPPVLFETMIFGGPPEIDLDQSRCSTYEQAEAEHWFACQIVIEVLRRRQQNVIDTIAMAALFLLGLTWTLL